IREPTQLIHSCEFHNRPSHSRPTRHTASASENLRQQLGGIAMRRAAMMILFAILAVAVVFAQNPGNANSSQSTVPQTQNGSNPNQNPDQSATPATNQNNPPANQTPTQPPTDQTNPTSNSTDSQTSGVNASGEVPAGTEIRATLDTPLSTKTSKPGDRFTATVSQRVQGGNGVVIPPDSRIEGEVAEAEQGKTLPSVRGRGKLNLRFRDIVLPNGQTVPLIATLVSVNNTSGKNTQKADNEGQVQSGTKGKDVAKDVGIGAGIAPVAVLILGAPLKGLAIGALAGGGYVLATNGKDVNLPAETGMVIRLDQPLSIQ